MIGNDASAGPSGANSATAASFASPLAIDRTDHGWLQLVVDSMREGFGLIAPDFTIVELNREALRIDGRPRESLVGQSHWDVYPGTEDSEIGRLYKLAMAQRVPVELEHPYHWPDGRQSWLETRAYPVENGCIAIFYRDVTERHLAEERLRTSEQRFKAAVLAIEGVLWTNTATGEMRGEQAGWASLTGQAQSQYQGHGWADAVHPADARPTIDAWQAAVAARAPFDFEHRVRRHDGVWRLFAIRAVPIFGADGEIVEWVGVHRDITQIRASELRLQQLAENIDEVFYVIEAEEACVSYVSRAYEQVWGRSRDELYADLRSLLAVVHPEDRPSLEVAMARRLRGEETDTEYRLQCPDGSERIIHDRAFPTRDPVTDALRVVGLAADITEYRRTQDLLARNAETFTNLVVSNPFGIYVVNADFRLIEISLGAQPVFSNIDPLIGRGFDEVIRIVWPEEFAAEVIRRFRHTLETGEPYVCLSTVEKRGNIDAVEAYDWRIERITLPDGRQGVVCYFYDLSERNAYEARLKQLLDDKDLLAREIDHRVKNSLTIVASFLAMQRRASDTPETATALDNAAERVLAVARVHELLHRSHQLGVVAFGTYLEQMCDELRQSLGRPGVELHVRAAHIDLPARAALSLALIANELVTNAFKHGCAGGATTITVDLAASADTVTLSVADNGSGLPASKSTAKAGLGLKLVTSLARQLQASIDLPASGAEPCISLTIPKSAVATTE